MKAGTLPDVVRKIQAIWKSVAPGVPFDYSFADDDVVRQYESYLRCVQIMKVATGFALFTSCLGLFALAGINAMNRTKEIGIRKVMGADDKNIVAQFRSARSDFVR